MANWILQGNPARSDVAALIEAGRSIESWSISRHARDLTLGDRAALWVGGTDAGIYALGEITGPSFGDVADDSWAEEYRGRPMLFASVRLDDFLDGDPILKRELIGDPRFSRARIVSQPQAGNPFLTTDEEWSVIDELLMGRTHHGL